MVAVLPAQITGLAGENPTTGSGFTSTGMVEVVSAQVPPVAVVPYTVNVVVTEGNAVTTAPVCPVDQL